MQRLLECTELEEVVFGLAPHRSGAAHHRNRILQIRGRIGGAAVFAGIPVLIGGAANRADAFDVAVRQKHFGGIVVGLADAAPVDVAGLPLRQIHAVAQRLVLRRVRRTEVIHADQHVGQVALMFDFDPLDQLLRGYSLGLRLEHDGRAVRVVGADVVALMAAKFLKPHPDVGLYGFENVAQMQWAIGIRTARW